MTSKYEPGVYVKGNQTRRATNRAAAVQAVWDGFVPASEVSAEDVDYRDLQQQARALGIEANQSKDALVKAIAEAPAESADSGVVDQDGDGNVTVSSDLGSPGSGEGDGSDAVDPAPLA